MEDFTFLDVIVAKHHWRGSCCEQSTVVETWGKKNKVGDERKRETWTQILVMDMQVAHFMQYNTTIENFHEKSADILICQN